METCVHDQDVRITACICIKNDCRKLYGFVIRYG